MGLADSVAIGLFAGWDDMPVEALVTCMGLSPVESCRCDCHCRISDGTAPFKANAVADAGPSQKLESLYGARAWFGSGCLGGPRILLANQNLLYLVFKCL